MKVRELIERLECMDPEAEVLIASQPSWPFEYSIAGLVERSDVHDEDEHDEFDVPDGEQSSDVFIVEGSQLRYGTKHVWEAIR